MTRRFAAVLLAFLFIRLESARAQALTGNVLRLIPSTIPVTCNTGDMRNDSGGSNLVKVCRSNTWITMLDTTNGLSDPTSASGDIVYRNATALTRLAIGAQDQVLAVGASAPTWTLINNANISSTAAIVDTKLATISTSGKIANSATTASPGNTGQTIVARDVSGNFSASTITAVLFSGTASVAQALTASSACSANQWANAISAGGVLTCALVSTASTSGTAAVAALAGAATAFTSTPTGCSAGQYATAIGPNGNLTCAAVTASSISMLTNWTSCSTTASWVQSISWTAMCRRVGDTREMRIAGILTGTSNALNLSISTLASDTIDTTKIVTASNGVAYVGFGTCRDAGSNSYPTYARITAGNNTAFTVFAIDSSLTAAGSLAVNNTVPFTFASTDSCEILVSLPITGLAF